jgi:PKHD-type hydroxylase
MSMIWERPDALDADMCDRLLALGTRYPTQAGGVLGRDGHAPDPRMRDVSTIYLPRDDATVWLYDRLDVVMQSAARAFGTRVAPIAEPVQLLRYDVGNHFNVWHSDAGVDLVRDRRVSASIELSEPDDYDGGLLEIAPDRVGVARTMPRGGMTAFPSRALHHVTPVVRGTRHALVIWAGG